MTNRMRFAKNLLAVAHTTEDEFKRLDDAGRRKVILGALNSDAMKNAAKAYGESWEGVTSTLEDKLQILIGKVGLPLFQAITKEIQRWNGWLDDNAGKVDLWAAKFADGLVTGFNAVKSAVSFLVDHADLLLAIGKVWAATRVMGLVQGGIGAIGALGAGAGAGTGMLGTGLFGALRGQAAHDEFDAEGGYKYTPATGGARSWKAAGIGDVAGALTMGYAIGTVLGETTGLFDAMNKAIDPTAAELERVQQQLNEFGAAMGRASKDVDPTKGGARTQAAANISAAVEQSLTQANLIDVAARARARANESGDMLDELKARKREAERDEGVDQMRVTMARRALNGGFGMDDAQALRAFAELLPHRSEEAATATDIGLKYAFAQFNGSQKELVDIGHANQDLMAENLRRLSIGMGAMTGQEAWGYTLGAELGMAPLKAMQDAMSGKTSGKPQVNVTIQRIEVQSDDPDRYVFGMVEAFRDYTRNPSQAINTLKEG